MWHGLYHRCLAEFIPRIANHQQSATPYFGSHSHGRRTETDYFILQQELLTLHELREPKHRSGLSPIARKVRLHHDHQKREDIISRRTTDV